jgi:hypothetical protein
MSRLVAGLALITGAVGCAHTAGTCDCLPILHPCAKYGLHAGEYSAPPAVIVADPKVVPVPVPAKMDPPSARPVTPPLGSPMLSPAGDAIDPPSVY